MSSELCRIIFDSLHSTYFAGQTVSGRVEITLQEPKKTKGVRIEIKGAAHVRWTESESDNVGGSRDTTYYANEEYFNSTNNLVDKEITLPPGNHVYLFSCPLPSNLPTSLEGDYGHIRYEAEVIIESRVNWIQRTKNVFTVISNYNLNIFPELLSSAMATAEEKFVCSCCCKSGPLTAVLRIPKSGYVCGEKIPVIIEVDNTSDVHIGKVNLKFQQSITFGSTYPRAKTRNQRIVLVETNLGSVQQRGSKTMSFNPFIPPLPASSRHNESAIIYTQYQVFLECVAEGCHTILEASIPITIGAIPFAMARDSSPPGCAEAVGRHINSETVGWTGSAMPSASVPSFEASEFFKAKSIEGAYDDVNTTYSNDLGQYAPTYPTYKYDYASQ